MSHPPLGQADEALVRSTSRRIAWQSGIVVALVIAALSALALVVALRQQHAQTDSLLRQAVTSADDVGDPPASTWLAIERDGTIRATPGLPKPLPDNAALERVARTGETVTSDLHGDDREFRIRTQRRGDAVVQAALDLGSQHEERKRLTAALLVVGGGGLVLSLLAGLSIGRRAVRPLAQALALQRDFVADASHELRTPLTLLSTRAQLLARALHDAGAPDELQDDGAGVVRDTSRLVAVIDDLLIAADTGAVDEREELDLGALTDELADSARAYAAQRGITLSSTATGDARVIGNPVALRRALTALVDNALEHTPSGGTVTLTAGRDKEGCFVDVTDTGSGLDPQTADRIFERFHSGQQRAGRRSYGLGLSLASAVAARHDGVLSVVDSGPAGTTFRLALPPV